MRIEWNSVTWYSKLIAGLLLVSLPFIGFYLGISYQKALTPQQNPIATTSATLNSQTILKTDSDNGSSVTLKQGEKLKVTLNSTYWGFNPVSSKDVLEQMSNPVYVESTTTKIPGIGAGNVTVEYLALSVGNASISASRTMCGEDFRCTDSESAYMLNVVVN